MWAVGTGKRRKTMSEFETVLRGRVSGVREELVAARASARDEDVYMHVARIEELLDLAQRHGVDTAMWIDRAELAIADAGR